MRVLWLWILSGIVVWPVHSTIATVGDKPIDMMLSDMLFLILPIAYPFIRSKPTPAQCAAAKGPIRWYSLTPALALIFVIFVTAEAAIVAFVIVRDFVLRRRGFLR